MRGRGEGREREYSTATQLLLCFFWSLIFDFETSEERLALRLLVYLYVCLSVCMLVHWFVTFNPNHETREESCGTLFVYLYLYLQISFWSVTFNPDLETRVEGGGVLEDADVAGESGIYFGVGEEFEMFGVDAAHHNDVVRHVIVVGRVNGHNQLTNHHACSKRKKMWLDEIKWIARSTDRKIIQTDRQIETDG